MVNKNKGFRDGKKQEAIEKLRDSLTKEELSRIDESRKLDNVPPESFSYKLAVLEDSLRKNFRNTKYQIKKVLWNIKNTNNQLFRIQMQIDTNKITEVVPETNVIMSKEELETFMMHMRWVQEGQALNIPAMLLQIRGIVGHYDIERKYIITEEEFDDYVKTIEKSLKDLGFSLFE